MSPDSIPDGDLTLTGVTIVTMNPRREVLSPGHLEIRDGAITAVGPGSPPEGAGGTVLDMAGHIVLPGFVNGHAHLVSVFTRGLGTDRFLTGGVEGGRERAFAIREALDERSTYAATRLALAELVLSGVTTTTDSYAARRGQEDALDGILRAWTDSGVRGIAHRASVNLTEIVPSHRHDSPDLARSELDRLATTWDSRLLRVGAEAMALHRVTRDMLEALDAWAAERGAPFAMHISYTQDSAEYAVREYGKPLMALLEDWGVLREGFLGHHPVWVDDDEVAAMARAGAGVSVCSAANMLIGLDPVPLPGLLDAGVRVSLGTDQPNDGHNFFEVMKATLLQQRAARRSTDFGSPELMLELATIRGAEAVGLGDHVGSLEVGKRADILVLDGRRPALSPGVAGISDVVLAASPADVEMVLIDGAPLVSEGRLVRWDEAEIAEEATRVVSAALHAAGIDTEPFTPWPVIGASGPAGG